MRSKPKWEGSHKIEVTEFHSFRVCHSTVHRFHLYDIVLFIVCYYFTIIYLEAQLTGDRHVGRHGYGVTKVKNEPDLVRGPANGCP